MTLITQHLAEEVLIAEGSVEVKLLFAFAFPPPNEFLKQWRTAFPHRRSKQHISSFH